MKFTLRFFLMFICSAFSITAFSEETKNYNDFVKGKDHQQGYFSFFHDQKTGKIFVEINQFEQDFLFQSGLPKGVGSNDIGLDRGQLGATRLVRFEKVGNKVFLRQLNTDYRADTDNKLENKQLKRLLRVQLFGDSKLPKKVRMVKKY